MVRVEQPAIRRDDAVAVGVGVVAGGDREFVLARDQAGHRVRRRAIHPDLAVAVQGHEPERRVDAGIDHGQVQAVLVGDLAPVTDAGAAERVGANPQAGRLDGLKPDNLAQRRHVGTEEVEPSGGIGRQRPGVRHPTHFVESVFQQLVRPVLDLLGDLGASRSAVGRVVLESAIGRRVVRRGDDDAVRPSPLACRLIVNKDRPRHRRGRRVPTALVEQHGDAVGREHFERTRLGGFGQRVGVDAEEQRTVDPGPGPVLADRLGGGEDVVGVERRGERRPAMTGGAELDPLGGLGRVGTQFVVSGDQLRDVDQVGRLGWLTRARASHGRYLPREKGVSPQARLGRPSPSAA